MKQKHRICRKCVLDNECLLQDNSDVDECEDVREYELKNKGNQNE